MTTEKNKVKLDVLIHVNPSKSSLVLEALNSK